MRNIENRVKRLEVELGDKPFAVQFIVVPREVPWEKRREYIRERADGRPMLILPESLSLEEAIAEVGCVEITAD
jgi:hypothetical protein